VRQLILRQMILRSNINNNNKRNKTTTTKAWAETILRAFPHGRGKSHQFE